MFSFKLHHKIKQLKSKIPPPPPKFGVFWALFGFGLLWGFIVGFFGGFSWGFVMSAGLCLVSAYTTLESSQRQKQDVLTHS